MPSKITYSAASHCGLQRSSNEDALLCDGRILQGPSVSLATRPASNPKHSVFVIADGIGGHSHGAYASRLALERLSEHTGVLGTEEGASAAINDVNRSLFRKMAEDNALESMGTTIAGVAFSGQTCSYFNVGDSRVYLLRNRILAQLTTDDVPTSDRPGKRTTHVITQALGGIQDCLELCPHFGNIAMQDGDGMLICSDGLTDMIDDALIESICNRAAQADVCEELLKAALEAGGRDNISVIVADFSAERRSIS